METTELQQTLFKSIKSQLPPHLSLADELVELLNLSQDSIYRRIRGEKPITLVELKKICEHYQISIDQLLHLQTDSIVFKASDISKEHFPFMDILRNMLTQLKYFNTFKNTKLHYLCKDVPIWHYFNFPELAAFKTFFWAKTIHNEPEYTGLPFSLKEHDFSEYFRMGQEIIREYNKIACTELWNVESINSTLSQIQYYKESGGFRDPDDVRAILDALIMALDHLQNEAERGQKFMKGEPDIIHRAPIQLYVNEVVIGSNTILVELDQQQVAILPYNVFSFLHTRDPRFCISIRRGIDIIQSRSLLISVTGEKERHRFFNNLRARVNLLRS